MHSAGRNMPSYLPLPSASSDTPLISGPQPSPSWSPASNPLALPSSPEDEKALLPLPSSSSSGHRRVFGCGHFNQRSILKLIAAGFFLLALLTFLLHPSSPSPTRLVRSPHSKSPIPYTWRSHVDPPLHLLFPLDERSHGNRSCKSLLAALVHGYEPTIVNWDVVGTPDELYSAKISGVYNYITQNLTSRNDDDVILMADSYDLWLQQSPRALLRRFREMEDAKIVIGADQWCWPNDPGSAECRNAPQSEVPPGVYGNTEPPRYANSGTVLGTLKNMRNFYQKLHAALAERPTMNDQAFFNELLAQGEVSIDYWYRLFWTTAGPGKGVVLNIRHPLDSDLSDPTIPYHLLPPIVYHSLSGEVPVALHFNNDASKGFYMDDSEGLWGKLWWTRKERRFRYLVRERLGKGRIRFAHDGSVRRWKDVCPSSILDMGSFH